MKATTQVMKDVPHLNMDHLSADEGDRERERLYRQYEDERNAEGEELDLAHKRVGIYSNMVLDRLGDDCTDMVKHHFTAPLQLRIHRLKRATIELELEQVDVDDGLGVCSWTIRFIDRDGPEIMGDLLKVCIAVLIYLPVYLDAISLNGRCLLLLFVVCVSRNLIGVGSVCVWAMILILPGLEEARSRMEARNLRLTIAIVLLI